MLGMNVLDKTNNIQQPCHGLRAFETLKAVAIYKIVSWWKIDPPASYFLDNSFV